MRLSFPVPALCLALLTASACSGSGEEKKPDAQPVETSAEETADPAVVEEAPAEEAPAEPALDLNAADLESLFTVSGNVDKDQISGVIGQKKPDVFKCYGDELANSPGLTGRVLVQITTTPNGSVASAIVKQSTLANAKVEQCMTSKMRGWKFPHDPSGGLVVIKYGFQLPP